MAASPRKWQDNVWLVWFIMQASATILVDAVDQYPHFLWEPEGSILRPLGRLFEYSVNSLNDPILGWKADSPQAHEMAYVGMLLWAEILFLMPVAVYGAWSLWPTSAKKGTTGPQELLFLVWCCEMFFSTAICINNVFWWDPVAYPADVKRTFVLTYGAWVVVPLFMGYDMYTRILARFRAADAPTSKKVQ